MINCNIHETAQSVLKLTTFVQGVDFLDVQGTEAVTLTYLGVRPLGGEQGGVTVPAERCLGIVHHAAVVIPYSQSVHLPRTQFIKVVSLV